MAYVDGLGVDAGVAQVALRKVEVTRDGSGEELVVFVFVNE